MTLTDHARQIFAHDRYATEATGITIDAIHDGQATCSLTLEPRHRNAKNAVMGGVLFTLADFAFAVAIHSDLLNEQGGEVELQWVSSSSTIHFLRPATGDRLTAITQCVKKGRRSALYEIHISDSHQREVALVITEGARIN